MMEQGHTQSFELKTVSTKNEGNYFDDFKNFYYKIIHFNFSQRKEFLTITCIFGTLK